MPAKTAKARIQKGKDLENHVAAQLREKGLDTRAERSPGSGNGNREKGDISTSLKILNQNVGIECKHYDTLAIQEWWRQTKKLESLSREPLLVFKQTADRYEDTRVVMYLDTLLELIKASQGVVKVQEVQIDNRLLKNALDKLRYAMKDVIKQIEE